MVGLEQPTSKSNAGRECIVKIQESLRHLEYSVLGTPKNLGLDIARSLGDHRYTCPNNSS
jgi:hypothetical protein